MIGDDRKSSRQLKMSRFKYNLGKEIAEYGNLLSDQGADTILDIIWYSCNINAFVTCAFTTANLNLGQFTEWIEIRRLFCNNGATEKNNGLYIIPSFMGKSNSGHWYLNAAWWSNNTGFFRDERFFICFIIFGLAGFEHKERITLRHHLEI